MNNIWEGFFTPADREVVARSGLGMRVGVGKRPALLVVDICYNFCLGGPVPLNEAIDAWPRDRGEKARRAIEAIRKLVDAFHGRKLPVFYSKNSRRPDGFDAGSWLWKSARELSIGEEDIRGHEIVADIAPAPQDVVVVKTKPSVFFGTPLLSFLTFLQVDTLVVVGTSTSGCVRATVLDAFSNNLRVQVVADGCFDSFDVSHAINLFDMDVKYADVIDLEEALTMVSSFPDDLFDLPPGTYTKKRA